MKIEFIEKIAGNLKFRVDGTIMYFWDSFKRSILSIDGFAQSYNFNKIVFNADQDGIIKFLKENEEFIKAYINKASKEQALVDSYKTLVKKRLVARLEDSILICEISLKDGYVSITANQIAPIKESILIKQGSEMWIDHLVDEEKISRTKAKQKVAQEVRMNGVEAVADISLFTDSFEYKKSTFFFESQSCGCLHKEIKQAFPENKILHKLIKMHLKPDVDMIEAIWLYSQIKSPDNYKPEVITIGKEIVRK